MGVLYLLGCFFSFLVMMNGGGSLPHPQAPCFHPSDVPFKPSTEKAIPRNPDPSIV